MAPSNTEAVETVWYRNTEHDTFHEVVKGSDLEKRLRREQRQVGDEEDDLAPAYERVSEATATKNPTKQPGYIVPKATSGPAAQGGQSAGPSEEEIQARVDAAVESAMSELVDALKAEKAAQVAEQPADPTPAKA